jgi:hypothetical protein
MAVHRAKCAKVTTIGKRKKKAEEYLAFKVPAETRECFARIPLTLDFLNNFGEARSA